MWHWHGHWHSQMFNGTKMTAKFVSISRFRKKVPALRSFATAAAVHCLSKMLEGWHFFLSLPRPWGPSYCSWSCKSWLGAGWRAPSQKWDLAMMKPTILGCSLAASSSADMYIVTETNSLHLNCIEKEGAKSSQSHLHWGWRGGVKGLLSKNKTWESERWIRNEKRIAEHRLLYELSIYLGCSLLNLPGQDLWPNLSSQAKLGQEEIGTQNLAIISLLHARFERQEVIKWIWKSSHRETTVVGGSSPPCVAHVNHDIKLRCIFFRFSIREGEREPLFCLVEDTDSDTREKRGH